MGKYVLTTTNSRNTDSVGGGVREIGLLFNSNVYLHLIHLMD